VGYDDESISISAVRRGKDTGKGKSRSISAYSRIIPQNPLSHSPSSSRYDADMSISAPIRPRKRPPESISMNGSSSSVLPAWSPRKRRKTESSLSVDDGLPFPDGDVPLPNGHSSTRRHSNAHDPTIDGGPSEEKKTRIMPSRAATHRPPLPNTRVRAPSAAYATTASARPKFMIKRIKLLVRPPPPSLSHHLQRPLRPKHSSLAAFLDSYMTLNDNDVTPEVVDGSAAEDAAILERIDSLRKEGKLLLGTDFVTVVQPKRQPDHWDAVIDAAVTRGSKRTNGGRQVAKQIAGKIQAYWDGFAAREDKAKVQEEKRLRALAKATIKAVVNEWKKAVFVRSIYIFPSFLR
jgi:helicase SWR1